MSEVWQRKVDEWLLHEVTQQFFSEITDDIVMLTEQLIAEGTTEHDMELKGMIKSLRGVKAMGSIDPLLPPEHYKTKE